MRTRFFVSCHPLVEHKLAHMRKAPEQCPSREFVRLMREIGMLLGYEVSQTCPLQEKAVATERAGSITVSGIFSQKPIVVPILRSGLVLAEGIREIIPTTYTGHIGLHKPPTSNTPEEYMVTIPGNIDSRIFILVDSVIATGATACAAIQILKDLSIPATHIRFAAVVATKQGKDAILKQHPSDIQFYVGTDSDELVGNMAVPGLGSVSSRLYRTG